MDSELADILRFYDLILRELFFFFLFGFKESFQAATKQFLCNRMKVAWFRQDLTKLDDFGIILLILTNHA